MTELRPVRAEELDAYQGVLGRVFSWGGEDSRSREPWRRAIELDRTLAVFEDAEIVATAGIASFNLTVPGAILPMAGVTAVSVLPTHRRRGHLSAIMRRQLDDIRARGEAVAGLYASEAPIYGRFGYGLATYSADLSIRRAASTFRSDARPPGRLRLIDTAMARRQYPLVWDAVRPQQVGMLDLPPSRWDRWLSDPDFMREGASEMQHVVYEADAVEGFAIYRLKRAWTRDGPDFTLTVLALMGLSKVAYSALWRYCLDVDLVTTVNAYNRSLEEPLRFRLADPRALGSELSDGLWLRMVDVPAALGGRRYEVEDRLVLEVDDELCPWNRGRYQLEGGPLGATCGPSQASADLALRSADLAAVYLGGNRFETLGRADAIDELRPGALRRADAMFRAQQAPWCPIHF